MKFCLAVLLLLASLAQTTSLSAATYACEFADNKETKSICSIDTLSPATRYCEYHISTTLMGTCMVSPLPGGVSDYLGCAFHYPGSLVFRGEVQGELPLFDWRNHFHAPGVMAAGVARLTKAFDFVIAVYQKDAESVYYDVICLRQN